MPRLIRTGAVASALLGLPGLAEAHTGVHPLLADGIAAGFVNPFRRRRDHRRGRRADAAAVTAAFLIGRRRCA
jgi:hypothetical protein